MVLHDLDLQLPLLLVFLLEVQANLLARADHVLKVNQFPLLQVSPGPFQFISENGLLIGLNVCTLGLDELNRIFGPVDLRQRIHLGRWLLVQSGGSFKID